MRPGGSLLRHRQFRILWAAGLLEDTIDWMLVTAIPIFVYRMTGSALITSVSFLAELIPGILISPMAGMAADRLERSRLLLSCALLQTALVTALLLVRSPGTLWLLYAVVAARAVCAQFALTTKNSLLPALVGRDKSAAASNLVVLNSNLGRLLGSFLGGAVVATGLPPIAAGSALTLLTAAALISRIRPTTPRPKTPRPTATHPEAPLPTAPGAAAPSLSAEDARSGVPSGHAPPEEARDGAAGARSPSADREPGPPPPDQVRRWHDGLTVVTRDPQLRAAFASAALCAIGQGLFSVLFVIFVATSLHGSDTEIGLLRSVQGIGGIAGGLVLGVIGARIRPNPLITWGALSFAVLAFTIWNAPAFTTATACYVALFIAVGLPGSAYYAGLLGIIQERVPPTHIGRTLGFFYTTSNGAQAIGMALSGILGDHLAATTLLNAQAALYLAAGLLTLAAGAGLRRAAIRETRATDPAPGRPPGGDHGPEDAAVPGPRRPAGHRPPAPGSG